MNKTDSFFVAFALLLFWAFFIYVTPLSWTKTVCWAFGSYYIGKLIANFSMNLHFNIEKEREELIEKNFAIMDDMLDSMRGMTKLIHCQQARIDLLMMEYCPEDITPEQWANWAAHQKSVDPEIEKKIKDALH